MNKIVRGVVIAVGILFGLASLGAVGFVAFVFSVGTAGVAVKLETSVLERATKAPVAGCLLAFEKGGVGVQRPATIDYGQTRERSDAQGRLFVTSGYSYTGSFLWPFPRERHPAFRFYLGEAPRYGTADEVESWLVSLRFDEPWRDAEVVPQLQVERSMAHEESRTRSGGFEPLAAQPVERLARARVRFESAPDGRRVYRVLLSVFLDEQEIAACRQPSLGEVEKAAADLFNSKRYADSLEKFREVARRKPDSAWAQRGVADCLDHLGRQRDAIDAYRKAVEMDPKDADTQFWYANCLIGIKKKDAVAQFEKLVAMEPGKPRGWIGLGNSLWDVDRYKESALAFEKASKLSPTSLSEADRKLYEEAKELAK